MGRKKDKKRSPPKDERDSLYLTAASEGIDIHSARKLSAYTGIALSRVNDDICIRDWGITYKEKNALNKIKTGQNEDGFEVSKWDEYKKEYLKRDRNEGIVVADDKKVTILERKDIIGIASRWRNEELTPIQKVNNIIDLLSYLIEEEVKKGTRKNIHSLNFTIDRSLKGIEIQLKHMKQNEEEQKELLMANIFQYIMNQIWMDLDENHKIKLAKKFNINYDLADIQKP